MSIPTLLERGADVESWSSQGQIALCIVSTYGYAEVVCNNVGVLPEHGMDPHSQTNEGWTPSWLGSVANHTEIMRLLSEHTGENGILMMPAGCGIRRQ